MNRTARFFVLYPWVTIAVTCAVTLFFAGILISRGIQFNGSPETLAGDDVTLRFYSEARQIFGDDRVIVVAITTSDTFAPDFLVKLDRLTRVLAFIDGVDDTRSLTNIKTIRRHGNDISIEKLIPPGAYSDTLARAEREALKESVTRDPLYLRHFISGDGRSASINVFLRRGDANKIRAVAEEVERVAKHEALPDEILLAGVPIIESRGVRNMLRDFAVLSPMAAALCFFVFLIAFRTFWGAALPMAVLMIGLTWTLGLMSLAGKPITLTTLAMPTVLMAVGASYVFHVLNQFRLSMGTLEPDTTRDERRRQWTAGLRFILPAVIVSATTTMAGFGALASSPVPTVRDMGIFNAAGVLSMLLLTVATVPAALSLLGPHSMGHASAKSKDYAVWLNPSLTNATALVLLRRGWVIGLALVFAALLGATALRLKVNTDYLNLFPKGSETVQDARKMQERLAGAATVQVVLTAEPGQVLDRKNLLAIRDAENYCKSLPGVDAALSIADIAEKFSAVAGSGGIESETGDYRRFLPEDESIFRLVDRTLTRASIVLRTSLYGSRELRTLIESIDSWSRQNLPANIEQQSTGSVVVLSNAADQVAMSQAYSLVIAIISIYLMMVALFRSFITGLIALLPNLLPIVGFFGFLGWARIPLDITTSLIASAVLGLAVDNAVHMIRRYRQSAAERPGRSPEDEGWIMWVTMLRTGKPMVLANLMLIAAFLMFVLSSFAPVRIGGILWALTILACLIADLVFLPALMKTKHFRSAALGALPDREKHREAA
jgi:predicted RND superfamily exporter protein